MTTGVIDATIGLAMAEEVTPAVHEMMVAVARRVVDERLASQARTDERLEHLTAAVEHLAAAQARTDESVKALAVAQARTDESVKALAAAQARTEERLDALAAAQARTDESVKALAVAQARTEERLDALAAAQTRTDESVHRLGEAQTRTEHALQVLARQVGGLSNTVGGDIEDIAYIVLHDVLKREFGWQVGELQRSWQTWNGQPEEVNVFGQAGDPSRPETVIWVVGEAKHNLTLKEVNDFVAQLTRARRHLHGEIFPVCFCYRARPEVQQRVREAGLRLVFSYGKLL